MLADAARRHGALLAVNDRADIALASRADVLHLGQDDLPLPIARDIIGPGPVIGRSTHDRAQVTAAVAEAVDYFCVGPCWPTPTKPGRPAPGLDLVRATAESASNKPWFAIGGIDERAAAGGARGGRSSHRRRARDHRGRRPDGRGRNGSKLGLQKRDSRRHLTQPLPTGGEPGMQRQVGHLVLGDPAQLGAFPVGHRLEQFGGVGDHGRVRPVAARRPEPR